MLPLISLIIPAYNRRLLLARCLRSLCEQTFADFEVIVVDDGSDEPLIPELQALLSNWPKLRYWHFADNRGRSAARNQGIELARGEVLIFLDSDMAVEPTFVAEHWRFHQHHGAGWIGQGQIIAVSELNARPEANFWTDASRAFFATGNVSVAKVALQAERFDQAFSEYGWEDLELGYRLKKAGYQRSFVKHARSYHYEPVVSALPLANWQRDLDKEQARGRGGAIFYRKHPCFEVALMTQLSALNLLADKLLMWPGETFLKRQIQSLTKSRPALALALYRALLNHYGLLAARQALWGQAKESIQVKI